MTLISSRSFLFAALCATLVMSACSSSDDPGVPTVDAGQPDAGGTDAGQRDAGHDAGHPDAGHPDAGSPDAGNPDAGRTCDADPVTGECGQCAMDACCDSLVACQDDQDCWACWTGADATACDRSPELMAALSSCTTANCPAKCGDPSQCDNAVSGLNSQGIPSACVSCLQNGCCASLAACNADQDCWVGCLQNGDQSACANNPAAVSFLACVNSTCSFACGGLPDFTGFVPSCDAPATSTSSGTCVSLGGVFFCNPVSNLGCGSAGEACDLSSDGTFQCFPPPNSEALCAACDNSAGPFCEPGSTCLNGQCVRYCCADSECGTGICNKAPYSNIGLGVCAAAP